MVYIRQKQPSCQRSRISGKVRMVASRKIRILHYGVESCQLLDLIDYFLESGWIFFGDTCQDFAVQLYFFRFHHGYKFGVTKGWVNRA